MDLWWRDDQGSAVTTEAPLLRFTLIGVGDLAGAVVLFESMGRRWMAKLEADPDRARRCGEKLHTSYVSCCGLVGHDYLHVGQSEESAVLHQPLVVASLRMIEPLGHLGEWGLGA